jgi:hypothetical protein
MIGIRNRKDYRDSIARENGYKDYRDMERQFGFEHRETLKNITRIPTRQENEGAGKPPFEYEIKEGN